MAAMENATQSALGTILFATDFSLSAERAGRYVKALAQRYASTVLVAHVVSLLPALEMPDSGISLDLFRQSSERNLEIARKQFVSAGIPTETILSESLEPAKEILFLEQKNRPDLIVIGTKGYDGLKLFVLGSIAETLIHHADCPVLTVGPHVQTSPENVQLEPIVCATDFSPEAAKAFSFVLPFAVDRGSQVYLCHVLPDSNKIRGVNTMELIAQFDASLARLIPDIARQWCEPECIVDHGNAKEGILLLAQRVNAGLIVLGTRRGSGWLGNIRSGIAYQVITAATCPVLTFRA